MLNKLLLDKTEAVATLSISINTLNRKVAAGKIPQPVRLGGHVLFRYTDLMTFVEAWAIPVKSYHPKNVGDLD